MQKTQDEKAKLSLFIESAKHDQNLEDQSSYKLIEYRRLCKESEKEIAKCQEDCNAGTY